MDMFEKLERDDRQRAAALKEFAHWKRIASELQELNYEVTAHIKAPSGNFGPHLRDKNDAVIFGIERVEIYGEGFYGRRTNRFQFRIETQRVKNFRELKAGGYNYAGIAAALVAKWDEEKARDDKYALERDNVAKCKLIREELGFEYSWRDLNGFDIKPTKYEKQPLKISFTMTKHGDADDARAMFKLLKDAGFINEG